MKNKDNTNISKKIYSLRKWIILGAFLLLFVVVVIASYSTAYAKTKQVAFEDADHVSLKKVEDFNVEFYSLTYVEPNKESKTNDLEFEIKLKLKDITKIETYKYSAIKASVAIGDERWTNRMKSGSSTTIKSEWTRTSTFTEASAKPKISSYDYSYPVRKMLFVKIDHPTVWLNLTYTKTSIDGSKKYEKSYCIKYTWNQYYVSGKTQLNNK